MRRILIGLTVAAFAVAGVGGTAALAKAPPKTAIKISLSTDGTNTGSSAVWGPKHQSVLLTVGTVSTDYALINLRYFNPTPPATAPTFTTDNYNSGSPRWVMEFSDGTTLFGYPSQADLGSSNWENITSAGGTYVSYTTALSEVAADSSLTGVFVVEDTDQYAGTTDTITDMTYDNQSLIP
jgi:hypothetical protein